jgi:hypothetical protein
LADYTTSLEELKSNAKKQIIQQLLKEKSTLKTKQFLKVSPEARALLQLPSSILRPFDTEKVFDDI